MRRDGVIVTSGRGQGALWALAKSGGADSDLANPADSLGILFSKPIDYEVLE